MIVLNNEAVPVHRWTLHRPPLWLAAYSLALAIWLVGLYLPLFFSSFPTPIDSLDFSYYLAGARIGLEHGWSHIYDLDLQRAIFYQLHPASDVFDWRRYFVSPPPVAWIVAPFTALPEAPAFWVFTSLSAVAFAVCGWLAVPGRGLGRLALFVTAACSYPVLIAIQTGQITPVVTAAAVLGWWLAQRRHQVTAGIVLIALLLKPQVAFLVGPALLIRGERKLFVTWLVGSVALTGLSIASLGGSGLSQLGGALDAEQGQGANLAWTLSGLLGTGVLTRMVEAAGACAALAVAWWQKKRASDVTIVAAILGTLLASPYHNPSDFAILAPAAWLQLRAGTTLAQKVWLGFGLLATYMAANLGPGPLLAFAAGWLVLIIAGSLGSREIVDGKAASGHVQTSGAES
ncbi:MAG: DUF2029 domain-containing protein [Candidatus Dormibacteraeota bacterium]|nr:DUF2029 domain-containing protein [Candidatus Dormibacteraeota bacterium]